MAISISDDNPWTKIKRVGVETDLDHIPQSSVQQPPNGLGRPHGHVLRRVSQQSCLRVRST
jgi:hypothetical protein